MVLGAIDYANPLLWAVLIGWIMSVVLHEFAHGLVAHLGGDYTIRQRGGLTLNPLQYVHPVFSLLLPAVFLLMGGIPLPGGATYVRTDLLRGRGWESAVSAAGPVTNFLLFLALGYAVHPSAGWVDPSRPVADWPAGQIFVAAMALLQLLAVILNLLPVPPLDGFGIISPFLPRETREKLMSPPVANGIFVFVFILLMSGALGPTVLRLTQVVTTELGMPFDRMARAFNLALFGRG